jgi:hypothetical protein
MTAPVVPILFGGLIAWSIYRRVRRNIGRQKLNPNRAIRSIVIISIFSVGLIGLSIAMKNMSLLLGIGGGLLPGAILGFIGLRLTRFETTGEGRFYTPNAHIGVALSILLIGRMAYRFWVVGGITPGSGHPPPMQSPLTYFIIGLTFGYYIVYQSGLFIHSRSKN